jgi:hypothetical protein
VGEHLGRGSAAIGTHPEGRFVGSNIGRSPKFRRHLSHPMAFLAPLLLICSGFAVSTGASPAGASTVSVTNCNDLGAGSLRATVAGASTGDTIDFAPSPACHLITLTSGFIDVTKNLTIDGPGASALAVSGNNVSGVLHVDSGVTASVSGLTIEDANENGGIADYGAGIRNLGTLTVTDTTLSNNTAELWGGGIYNGGTLTVTGSTLSGNTADLGGGIFNGVGTLTVTDSTLSDNTGGGIDNGDAGTVTVTGCTFSGNGTSGADGSGINQDDGGTVTVTDSTISGNTGTTDVAATTAGGGIYTFGGTLTVTDSTISGNSVTGGGGGMYVDSSILTVTDSTISGNSAIGSGGNGGGIGGNGTFTVTGSTLSDNTASTSGGGINYSGFDTLSIADSTLSGNSVTGSGSDVEGGAISNFDGTVTLTHSTLSGNTAPAGDGGGISTFDGSTTVVATIVANSGSGLDCTNNVTFMPPADGGYNLDDDGSCGFSGGNHSLSDTPAGLNPSGLANNGGSTQTIALEPFSAALGHVTAASDCTGDDQTGAAWSTPCNIGAIAGPPPVPGPYSPLAPVRICDSRPVTTFSPGNQCNTGAGQPIGAIGAGGTKTIRVTNGGVVSDGVPADAISVVLNVTAVNPSPPGGYMTVWPAGAAQPNASNLNYSATETVPNLVQVGVGSGGDVSFFSSSHTDLLVDVEGYTAPTASGGSGAGLYNALSSPVRLCDTRGPSSFTPANQCDGPGNAAGTLSANVVKNVNVTGTSIPMHATAAVLNVTVVNPAAAGFLTAYPQGSTAPNASNLNFGTGQTTTNRVIVPLSSTGQISLVSSVQTDALVDVSGYYSAPLGTGAEFSAEPAPVRICDTRAPSSFSPSNQCSNEHLASGTGHELNLKVTNGQSGSSTVSDGVPATATAVVVNLTGIAPSAATFLTVFPGPTLPNSSDLNPAAGETRANLVVATVNANGTISVFNNAGSLDVIVDVLGWYSTST